MRLKSGQLLRTLMDTKNMSNADVAIAAGCGRTFISALVNERRKSCTPAKAERIALYLGVPLELIFDPQASAVGGGSDKMKRPAA